ncbi:unnamed protein product, partial [Mesorhabditis belari]|uniref:F-ATPase delta subunit n=1 Tax=Mesorhabditis belari TaxID=2138241 RepID=A0AAF3ECM8_9BILA
MLARSVRVIGLPIRRGFAAAAAPAAQGSADQLRLTFASPYTALYNNANVKQVDVPTLAGVVGVLANHVPTIGVLKPGVVQVTDMDGKVSKYFVSSGTLSMNIDGSCQVLAEEAIQVDAIDETAARTALEAAQRAQNEGSEKDRAEAGIRAEVADALLKAVGGAH